MGVALIKVARISNHTAKNAKVKHPRKFVPIRYIKLYYTFLSVCQLGPAGPHATRKHNQLTEFHYNDVNAQCANVTDSMQLRNTKPPV